tara:strand:- start:39 stop:239 length:201 start_codon:yes stop_codon:yes gene_type:complete
MVLTLERNVGEGQVALKGKNVGRIEYNTPERAYLNSFSELDYDGDCMTCNNCGSGNCGSCCSESSD